MIDKSHGCIFGEKSVDIILRLAVDEGDWYFGFRGGANSQRPFNQPVLYVFGHLEISTVLIGVFCALALVRK